MKNFVIGILSSKQSQARIKGCRASWAGRLKKAGYEHVFIVGDPALGQEYRKEGDFLFVRCQDDYDSVVFKTHFFFKWAVSTGAYDYFFKCDDDTYVNIEEFLRFEAEGRDFIGHRLHLDAVGYYPSGGAGYFLSRRSAGLIASSGFYEYICQDHAKRPEDVLVALFLSKNGIALSPENRLLNHMRCKIFEKWITCHHITEEADFRTPVILLPWRLYAELRMRSLKRYFSKALLLVKGLFRKKGS
jgi:hypothetical protein